LGMYIIALGTGGIKPNVSTLGADQFDERYSQDRRQKESFFNWFYWSINLGALISYSLVAYVCQYGISSLGGPSYAFIDGYAIPTIMMGLAVIIFVIGSSRYTIHKPEGSVIFTFFMICYEALWKKRSVTRDVFFLDKAKHSHGGSFSAPAVEGSKAVIRLIPFLFAMIPYWGVYSQMSTVFQNQGCQMDLSLGEIQMPVSALNVFDTIAILLLVPLFDQFVYPFFKKMGLPLTMLMKIQLGFLVALLSMITAGVVEQYRLGSAPTPGNYTNSPSAIENITPCQNIDDYNPYQFQSYQARLAGVSSAPAYCSQTCDELYYSPVDQSYLLNITCISCADIPQMSSISVFYQTPQFVLVGISEILASITSLEFFYSQAPVTMRSAVQSLNLLTTSLGSLIIVPIVYLVNINPASPWLPSNLDNGQVMFYFFVLAGIMLLDMFYFYYIGTTYEYKTTADLTFEEEEGDSLVDSKFTGNGSDKSALLGDHSSHDGSVEETNAIHNP